MNYIAKLMIFIIPVIFFATDSLLANNKRKMEHHKGMDKMCHSCCMKNKGDNKICQKHKGCHCPGEKVSSDKTKDNTKESVNSKAAGKTSDEINKDITPPPIDDGSMDQGEEGEEED